MNAETLWNISRRLHQAGATLPARLIKAIIFFVFKSVLPPEAKVGTDLQLGHYGVSLVIHPNVQIGNRVRIWHNVTLAVSAPVGSDVRIIVEDDVTIGAHSVIVTREGQNLFIGKGSVIAAGSIVTRDVADGTVVAGNPAKLVHRIGQGISRSYR